MFSIKNIAIFLLCLALLICIIGWIKSYRDKVSFQEGVKNLFMAANPGQIGETKATTDTTTTKETTVTAK